MALSLSYIFHSCMSYETKKQVFTKIVTQLCIPRLLQ